MSVFSPETVKSNRRFYLIHVSKGKSNEIVPKEVVLAVITSNILQLYGSEILSKLNQEVFNYGIDKYIISICNEFSVIFRSSLLISFDHPRIRAFSILNESGFIQTLIHDSREFFPPGF